MFHDILVPLDGSEFAERALPLASRIAQCSGAMLHLARVHPTLLQYAPVPGVPLLDPALEEQERAEERRYLRRKAVELESDGLRVQITLLDGPAGPRLAEHAGQLGIDLVVLTTHGRDPLSRMWLGSVADYLLRHLTVPRLLIHSSGNGHLPPTALPRRILVPLDRSPLAESAIGPAVALGKLAGAELVLLSVVEPIVPIGDPGISYPADLVREALDSMEQCSQEYLERLAGTLRCDGQVVTTRCVVDNRVARRIDQEAQRAGCDLIAIATHGAGGMRRLVLGSVTDKVVRGASVPVLVMGGHGEEPAAARQVTPE